MHPGAVLSKGQRYQSKGQECWWERSHMQQLSSVHSVLSNSATHGLQHVRLLWKSPTPGAYSNSCPSHWWCHTTISSSCCPLLLLPSIFPSIRVFSNESVFHIRWSKYWSFSISPSNEYSGLISFRIDWLDLFAVQETLLVSRLKTQRLRD